MWHARPVRDLMSTSQGAVPHMRQNGRNLRQSAPFRALFRVRGKYAENHAQRLRGRACAERTRERRGMHAECSRSSEAGTESKQSARRF